MCVVCSAKHLPIPDSLRRPRTQFQRINKNKTKTGMNESLLAKRERWSWWWWRQHNGDDHRQQRRRRLARLVARRRGGGGWRVTAAIDCVSHGNATPEMKSNHVWNSRRGVCCTMCYRHVHIVYIYVYTSCPRRRVRVHRDSVSVRDCVNVCTIAGAKGNFL